MKILLFLLIPVLLFSQTPDYPDTLYLKSGKIHPCLITQIDENVVRLKYKNNMPTSAGLELVNKIYMEHYKFIYENNQFTTEISEINNYVNQRNDKIQVANDSNKKFSNDNDLENKLSFGVLYSPIVNPDVYIYIYDPYYGMIKSYIIGKLESSFDSQFSFEISPSLWFTIDIGYGSSHIKERNDYFRTSTYDTTRDGNEYKYDMDFFNFNIGLKYYFTKLLENRVSPYFLVGLGKKMASVKSYDKDLYPSPYNQTQISDNQNEFLEDINSPLYSFIGFGVEYFFNKFLSINANMQLNYVSFSGEYKYKYIVPSYYNYIRITTKKFEYSQTTKRAGIGLNFYF